MIQYMWDVQLGTRYGAGIKQASLVHTLSSTSQSDITGG